MNAHDPLGIASRSRCGLTLVATLAAALSCSDRATPPTPDIAWATTSGRATLPTPEKVIVALQRALGEALDGFVFDEVLTIYDEDDRVAVALNAPESAYTVALVPHARLTEDGASYSIADAVERLTHFDEHALCPEEPFVNERQLAECSGVLVADDLVLTAGHCVKDDAPCAQGRCLYVFDYFMGRETFDEDDVYEGTVVDWDNPGTQQAYPDWGLVRLVRAPSDRTHVQLASDGDLHEGDELSIVGFPLGVPMVRAGGAKVIEDYPGPRFSANLDALPNNSGSPVLDREDRLVGVFLRTVHAHYSLRPRTPCARTVQLETEREDNFPHVQELTKELRDAIARARARHETRQHPLNHPEEHQTKDVNKQ